jgi:hypothetical protein
MGRKKLTNRARQLDFLARSVSFEVALFLWKQALSPSVNSIAFIKYRARSASVSACSSLSTYRTLFLKQANVSSQGRPIAVEIAASMASSDFPTLGVATRLAVSPSRNSPAIRGDRIAGCFATKLPTPKKLGLKALNRLCFSPDSPADSSPVKSGSLIVMSPPL